MSTPRKWYKKNKSGRVICSCGREMIRNAYVHLRYQHLESSMEEACTVVSDLHGVGVGLVMDVKVTAYLSKDGGQIVLEKPATLCTQCLVTSTVPESWKDANIILIHKLGDVNDLKN